MTSSNTQAATAIAAAAAVTPPTPGQHWPAKGGTYIGIAPAEGGLPMRHLVVLDDKPASRLVWKDAMAWAEALGDGARLPTQLEAVFAFTTSKAAFDPNWHWTCTQTSSHAAFVQVFENGLSHWGSKDDACRVRAVRGFDLQTFEPLALIAAGDSTEKNGVSEQVSA